MIELNDLSILLTKKIESELVRQFFQNKEQPNFYSIRKTILNVLEENMDVLSIQNVVSHEMLSQMTKEMIENYKNHELKKNAVMLVEKIIDSEDHFEKWVYEDEYSNFKKTTKSIIVLKTGKICKEIRRKNETI